MTERAAAELTDRTVSAVVDLLAGYLRRASFEAPVLEAREIVAALHDAPRFWPVANAGLALEQATVDRALRAVSMRMQGAPLAYAVGRAAFRKLTLTVDERVLIPRPETERLVDLALEHTPRNGGVAIDVCTGSGAIALALATEGRFARIYGTDISRDALAVAQSNVDACEPLRTPVFPGSRITARPTRRPAG